MRRFSLAFAFVGATLLPSCANWSSTLAKVKIEKGIELSKQVQEALASEEFQKGFWPEQNWWEIFDDRQLAEFIEKGLSDNPSLAAAEARVRQANQEAFIARSKLLPKVGSTFNYLYSYLSKKGLTRQLTGINRKFNLFGFLFDFSYEFDFWKKNRNAYEAALGEMHVHQTLHHQAQILLSVAIARQYYDLQASMAKMAILQEMLDNRSKLFRLTELRRINRIDNALNINSIKQDILSLQEVLATLAGELKIQKNLLMILMGQNPDEEITLVEKWDFPDQVLGLPDHIGLGLLARRPDLRAQVWRIFSITKKIGVSIAEFLPDVSLWGFGGSDAVHFQDLLSGNSGTVTVLPLINTPIFRGGELRAKLKSNLAAYETAVYEYNDLLLKAANEVVSSLVKVRTSQERINYQRDEVASKQNSYELIYSRYKHGIDSMLSVLNADEKYLRSRIEQIELACGRVQATIDLIHSLGGGYHDDKAEKQIQEAKLIRSKKHGESKMDACTRGERGDNG